MYVAGSTCPPNLKATNKIILITGATSGIGLEVAKELVHRGATIILTGRCQEKLLCAMNLLKTIAPNANVHPEILDVSSIDNIRNFCKKLEIKYERIDVLINNAGTIFEPYRKTKDENLEITIATNYFGPFLLSHLLLPLLQKSSNGRIINMSSMAHYGANINLQNLNCEMHYNEKEVFGQSKLALILFSRHLTTLLKAKKSKITINCVSPGLVRGTNHFAKSPMQDSWMIRVSTLPWVWLFLKTAKQGCQTVVYAAIDPSINEYSGRYFSDCEQKDPSTLAQDCILAEELYKKSLEYCNLNGVHIEYKLD